MGDKSKEDDKEKLFLNLIRIEQSNINSSLSILKHLRNSSKITERKIDSQQDRVIDCGTGELRIC